MNILELAVVVSAVDRATSVLRGVQGGLSATAMAADKMKAAAQGTAVVGAMMSQAGGQIISGLGSMMAPAEAVQDALAKVQTVVTPMSGTMVDALGRIEGAAWSWSAAHKATAAEFVDTTYMMISAGMNEKAAVAGTQQAMLVATATMGDATEAANLLGGVYNTMGDKTGDVTTEMARLGDVITKTQQTFQFANLGQLNEGLKYAIPAALQTGASFEELNTVIGHLNSNQLQGSMAGTALAATMGKMNSASGALKFALSKTSDGGLDLIGTIANIESKYGTLTDMSPKVQESFRTAFGDEGWRALSLMLGRSEELRLNLAKVKDSAGAAAAAAAVIEGTDTANWGIIANQLDRLKASVAGSLAPAVREVVPLIQRGVAALGGWVERNPELTRQAAIFMGIVGAVLAVVGPVLMGVGALGMFGGHVVTGAAMLGKFGTAILGIIPALGSAAVAAWGFAAALLANPITWIVLAVVAAAALIYIYWDPIKAFFVGLWDELKAAFDKGWVNGILKVLQFFSPLYWVMRGFNALSEWLFGFSLYDAAARVMSSITGGISGMWGEVKSAFNRGWLNGIVRVLMLFSPVYWVSRAFNALSQWILGYSLREAAARVMGSLLDGLASTWGGIVAAFDRGLLQGIAQLFKTFSPVAWMATALSALSEWLFGFTLADAGVAILDSLIAGLGSMWDGIVSAFDQGFIQGLEHLFMNFSPLGWMMQALSALSEWLFGFTLADAGVAILDSLLAGLGSMWDGIVNAFDQGLIQGLEHLFMNFSPLGWMMQALSALSEWLFGFTLADAGMAIINSLLSGLASVWGNIVAGFQQGPLQGLLNLVGSFTLVGLFANIINAISEEVFGFSLYEAGGNILRTLTDGILAAASGPITAVRGVVQKVRNLLPFSPAKEGPLSDLHRVRLIETVADAVRPGPLVDAMRGAASQAVAVLPAAVPSVAPMPPAVSRGGGDAGGAGGAAGGLVVNINIAGSADASTVDRLEQWARQNSDLLFSLMQSQQQTEARGAY